jgi:hypothetical protein
MRKPINSDFHADACKKIEKLDIYRNPAAQTVFCSVAIDYARHELRSKGIDLLTIVTYEDLSHYCQLSLKKHPDLDPEMALIVVTHAIELNVKEITKTPT